MIVPLEHILLFAGVLFFMGLAAVVVRRNLVMILLGVEVMLNAAGIAFVGASLRWMSLEGQGFVLFIMGVAAAEVALGLALVVYARSLKDSLDPNDFSELKG